MRTQGKGRIQGLEKDKPLPSLMGSFVWLEKRGREGEEQEVVEGGVQGEEVADGMREQRTNLFQEELWERMEMERQRQKRIKEWRREVSGGW